MFSPVWILMSKANFPKERGTESPLPEGQKAGNPA